MDPNEATKILLRKKAQYEAYKAESKGLRECLKQHKGKTDLSLDQYTNLVKVLQNLEDLFSDKSKGQICKLIKTPKPSTPFKMHHWHEAYSSFLTLDSLGIIYKSYMSGSTLSELASQNALTDDELRNIEYVSSGDNGRVNSKTYMKILNQPSLTEFVLARHNKALKHFLSDQKLSAEDEALLQEMTSTTSP